MLVIRGLKDRAFGSHKDVRDRRRRDFPNAGVIEINDASHNIQQDAAAEIVSAIKSRFAASG